VIDTLKLYARNYGMAAFLRNESAAMFTQATQVLRRLAHRSVNFGCLRRPRATGAFPRKELSGREWRFSAVETVHFLAHGVRTPTGL